jgi:hypothetical protein
MPKKIPNEEFEAIVTVVAAHPGGVKIDAIRKGLDITLPERMLQRRLRRLANEGRIVAKGTGKGKRYFPKRRPKPETGEKSRSTPATGGSDFQRMERRSNSRSYALFQSVHLLVIGLNFWRSMSQTQRHIFRRNFSAS